MKTKKPKLGSDYKFVYEQALNDSKACLIDMLFRKNSKKIQPATNYDFFEKIGADLELFNTWMEYTYALVKQKYSYTNKKHFYKYIEETFF
jgi:hypothetical protein